jgi:hypothetical protein
MACIVKAGAAKEILKSHIYTPKACIHSGTASGTFGKDCHSSPTLEYGTKQSTSPSTRMPNNGKIRNAGTRCNCI